MREPPEKKPMIDSLYNDIGYTASSISRLLKMPITSVNEYIGYYRLKGFQSPRHYKNNRKNWRPTDDFYLLAHHEIFQPSAIAVALKRSKTSVSQRLNHLKSRTKKLIDDDIIAMHSVFPVSVIAKKLDLPVDFIQKTIEQRGLKEKGLLKYKEHVDNGPPTIRECVEILMRYFNGEVITRTEKRRMTQYWGGVALIRGLKPKQVVDVAFLLDADETAVMKAVQACCIEG